MRWLILVALVCLPAFSQGWTQLTNTKLQTVCPPDNFAQSYGFTTLCVGKITDYSSAVVDTNRNRLIIWGGGHGGYKGNETYSLDLSTKSTSTGTSCTGASSTCSTNASAPTMTRLDNPSTFSESADGTSRNGGGSYGAGCVQADAKPVPQHTWGALVFLPQHDAVFQWLGYDLCGAPDRHIWWFHADTQTWEDKGLPTPATAANSSEGAFCVLNPFPTTPGHESVLCLASRNRLYEYDANDNTATLLAADGGVGGYYAPLAPSLVIDPGRKLLFAFGSTSYTPTAGAGRLWVTDLDNGYSVSDWTEDVTGCADLIGYGYPSVVWSSTLNRVVGYVPRTVASSAAHNLIFTFDPSTKACAIVQDGGGPSAHAFLRDIGTGVEQGMFGRFGFVPSLNRYVLVNSPSVDAYAWSFAPASEARNVTLRGSMRMK